MWRPRSRPTWSCCKTATHSACRWWVQLACAQATPAHIRQLRELIACERDCIERDQRGPAIRLSGEFHLQLAEMAGNAPLAHFIGSLVPLISLAIAQFDAALEDDCVWQLHAKIVDALACMDAAMGVTLLNRHLDHLEAVLLNAQPLSSQKRIAG